MVAVAAEPPAATVASGARLDSVGAMVVADDVSSGSRGLEVSTDASAMDARCRGQLPARRPPRK